MSPKGQGLISSYFAKPSSQASDDIVFLDDDEQVHDTNALPGKRNIQPDAGASPAPKKRNIGSTTTSALNERGPNASIRERMSVWRFQSDEPVSSGSAPSQATEGARAEKERRHEAFRERLLGPDHPFRRRIAYAEKGNVWRPDVVDTTERELGETIEETDVQEQMLSPEDAADTETGKDAGPERLEKFRSKGGRTAKAKGAKAKGKAKSKYTPLEEQWIAIKERHVSVRRSILVKLY
jgi:hypothetical protein